MLIGRTDDPPSPCSPTASKAANAFGRGSRNPSGPAAVCRTSKAGHTNATAPDQKIFTQVPCTQRAVHTRATTTKGRAMTVRLVDKGWDEEFVSARRKDAAGLVIICPFIKDGALSRLLNSNGGTIRVITRFNLDDFASGVSDIAALRRLLDLGAEIRGLKNLHAKVYVFGKSSAIVTSANLTHNALSRNHEFGLVAEDTVVINACLDYFEVLWRQAGRNVTAQELTRWDKKIVSRRVKSGGSNGDGSLGDFGADAGFPPATTSQVPNDARQTAMDAVNVHLAARPSATVAELEEVVPNGTKRSTIQTLMNDHRMTLAAKGTGECPDKQKTTFPIRRAACRVWENLLPNARAGLSEARPSTKATRCFIQLVTTELEAQGHQRKPKTVYQVSQNVLSTLRGLAANAEHAVLGLSE